MKTRTAFLLVALIVVALFVTSCADYELLCCKTVNYWWGSYRLSCKTVYSNTLNCPAGYTLEDIISSPTIEQEW